MFRRAYLKRSGRAILRHVRDTSVMFFSSLASTWEVVRPMLGSSRFLTVEGAAWLRCSKTTSSSSSGKVLIGFAAGILGG